MSKEPRYDATFASMIEAAARATGAVTNMATGEGSEMDKSTYSMPARGQFLSRDQIRGLLANSWLANQAISLNPEHCVLGGIEISFDDDTLEGDVKAELDALKTLQTFREAHCTARAFGGAAILLLIDDGSSGTIDQSRPLYDEKGKLGKIKELKGLYMIEAGHGGPIHPAQQAPKWCPDAKLLEREPGPNFAKPVWWEWNPVTESVGGEQLEQGILLHRDRLIFLPGAFTDKQTKQDRDGWDLSILNAAVKTLMHYESSQTSTVNIIYDFFTVVLKVKDYKKIITTGGLQDLIARFRADAIAQSVLHARVCDAVDEDIVKVGSPVSGLEGLIDKLMDNVAGAFRTPRSLLFREAPKSGGRDEAGQEFWQQDISTAREQYYTPGLLKVIEILQEAEIRPASEKKVLVGFKPLKQVSEKERAEAARTLAHADEINIKDGIYGRKEARGRYLGVGGVSELKLEGEEPPSKEEVQELQPDPVVPGEQVGPGTQRMSGENTEAKGKVPNSAAKRKVGTQV